MRAWTTALVLLGPVIVIGTSSTAVPVGAVAQSTVTSTRVSFVICPLAGVSVSQGAFAAVAVNANAVDPLLNTSMYWFDPGGSYGVISGKFPVPVAPGQTFSEPSTATPSAAAVGTVSVCTAGIVLVSGDRHASVGCEPICACFIMWFHLPLASVWYWVVNVASIANSCCARVARSLVAARPWRR